MKQEKIMNTKTTVILASLVILVSILAGVFFYQQLPDPMASHWNINDEVDGYMGKFWGVFMLPLISVGLMLLLFGIPYLDPLKENIVEFRGIFNAFIFVMQLFLAYVWSLTIVWNLTPDAFKIGTALLPAMGLLFIFVGYMVRSAKRNWFIGIRTPWTLSSDYVWKETHRLGGALFIASGILSIIGVFFGVHAFWFVLLPVIGSTVFLYIYSYILFQGEKK
jgi:uncharacterized membrane protein